MTLSRRSLRNVALFALMSTLALPLASCAQAPDPQETKESIEDLSQQTDEPELSDAEQEFSVTEHPDPIVDPLDCSTHLILTVRGTSEPPKGQLLSPVARQISQALPKDSAQVVDLDYPASGDMEQSGTEGVRMLIDTLNVQAKECELQRVIVMGYSQGAMVVGDALEAADDRTIGRASGEVNKDAAATIEAVLLYADPRFRGSEVYNAGDFLADANGLLPRAEGALDTYADRTRSFCVADDFICQGGEFDETGHVKYYSNGMQDDGAEFVLDLLRENGALDADPSRDNSPSPGDSDTQNGS
ncbi:MAG: cutinase family protein [Canibacter sp.]